MELATYSAAVNKVKMVEQGLNKIKGKEASKSQVYLGKRPATGVIIQDKGKRPAVQPLRPTAPGTDKRCNRCQGPHDLRECKWLEGT